MERLNSVGPEFAVEMTRLQADMQVGVTPDPDRLRSVANQLTSAVDEWETLIARLRLSSDFQTREYAKLTQAHLTAHDQTVEQVAAMMRWQADCMRAMADQQAPPMPPPEVDLAKMMEQAQSTDPSKQPPSMAAMAAAEKITSTPFTGKEAAFSSPTVDEEYKALCRDHMQLIEFGAKYADFDPAGKLIYLDQIEAIEERWDVFFTRFKLMGALNPEYQKQCKSFLASMSLDETQYRELLKTAHELMRQEAERERNMVGV